MREERKDAIEGWKEGRKEGRKTGKKGRQEGRQEGKKRSREVRAKSTRKEEKMIWKEGERERGRE